MKKLLFALAVLMLFAPMLSQAQQQSEEKMLVGRVQSVDPSGTEITLTDGTRLLTPPGAKLQPGALERGVLVVAVYRERENGDKVLIRLSREQREPAAETTPPDEPASNANAAAQCSGPPRRSPVMFGAVCA